MGGSYPITKGGKVTSFRSRGSRSSKPKPRRVVIVRENLMGSAEAFAKVKGWKPEDLAPKKRQYCFWDANQKPNAESCNQCHHNPRMTKIWSECGIKFGEPREFGRPDAYPEPSVRSNGIIDQPALERALTRDGVGFSEENDRLVVTNESDSHPGTYYATSIWTGDSGRFHAGDVSCTCKGWIFRKSCKHTELLVHRYL